MANVFLAAALLSGILTVSGCMGLPNLGALGSALGGYPSYGGAQAYGGTQAYPYNYGAGGGYAQPVQPYYQPQAQVYSGDPGVYTYQPSQVPQATGENTSPPQGRWSDRRHQRQQDRIQQGLASGQLTPREARRLQNEQATISGAGGQLGTDGNLSSQGGTSLNAIQQKNSQGTYRLRQNGVQSGPMAPTVQSRPTGPARPMAQVGPAGQPRTAVQPRAAVQPRVAGQARATAQPRSNSGTP
jgi:hypothetical protein